MVIENGNLVIARNKPSGKMASDKTSPTSYKTAHLCPHATRDSRVARLRLLEHTAAISAVICLH
jgi:hypothetical protein